MYPVKRGYAEVSSRLQALIDNEHYGEALLASVFVMEKTIRRTLRFCALNRGFTSKQCDRLFQKMGFHDMVTAWPVFERCYRTLPEFVGPDVWQHVSEAVTMRNKLVHGSRVYNLSHCRDKALTVKTAIEVLRDRSIQELGCDPWHQLPARKKTSLIWHGLRQPRLSVN